jgi:hypothetical protein
MLAVFQGKNNPGRAGQSIIENEGNGESGRVRNSPEKKMEICRRCHWRLNREIETDLGKLPEAERIKGAKNKIV